MLSPPVVIRQDVAETGFKFFVERAREHRVEPVAGPAPLRCLRGADRSGLYEFQTLQKPRFTDPLDGSRPGSLSGWPIGGRYWGDSPRCARRCFALNAACICRLRQVGLGVATATAEVPSMEGLGPGLPPARLDWTGVSGASLARDAWTDRLSELRRPDLTWPKPGSRSRTSSRTVKSPRW